MLNGTTAGVVRFTAIVETGRCKRAQMWEHLMIEWIVILLIVAAVASLLGFRGVAGASAGIAKILIFIVLVGLLLMLLFGVLVFA